MVRSPTAEGVEQLARSPMPRRISPMLATASKTIPSNPKDYSFEYKWDGVRAITYWDQKHLIICSRNDNDITTRYPELHPIAAVLGRRSAILDGEIIAIDNDHRPNFGLLQQRMHVQDRSSIARLCHIVPVTLMVFDLLYLDGRVLMHLPLLDRRAILEDLNLLADAWQLSPAIPGEGGAMLESASQQHLEGIIAKRADSIYEPGRRSAAWLKIKLISRQEFVIGGWIPEGQVNTRRVGALLVGYFDPRGRVLHYAGRVGTGFDATWHQRLTHELSQRATRFPPFAEPLGRAPIRYVLPELVAEVEYRRWPVGGLLQQAAFKGLRTDKPLRRVVDERVTDQTLGG